MKLQADTPLEEVLKRYSCSLVKSEEYGTGHTILHSLGGCGDLVPLSTFDSVISLTTPAAFDRHSEI